MMTKPDDPNEDERSARTAATLKETEDLLAGFDRPGRTPRTPPVKRDFVDYHLDKGRSNPATRAPAAGGDRRDLPTAIIPNKKRTVSSWLPWAALLLTMSIGGVLVAASLVGAPKTTGEATSSTPTQGATTIAWPRPTVEATSGPERDIPAPTPAYSAPATNDSENVGAIPPTSAATASPTTRPHSSSTASPPSPHPSTSVTPSGDFIRNL